MKGFVDMGTVRSIFVEKKSGFDVVAQALLADLRENLKIKGLNHVRVLIRYDLEGITDSEYETARTIIFAEPPVDLVYDETFPYKNEDCVFAVEYLPGQYDQRADSAAPMHSAHNSWKPPPGGYCSDFYSGRINYR